MAYEDNGGYRRQGQTVSLIRMPSVMKDLSRRSVLQALAGAGAAGLLPRPAQAKPVRTAAHIVIAGAGAAGISMASNLLKRLDGARITVIDAKRQHHFQPGYTLVAAGLWQPSQVVASNGDYLPRGVTWINEAVAEFDPEGSRVVTASGQAVAYDWLVVATGLTLDYQAIAGMDQSLIGRDGIASIYAGPEAARASYEVMAAFAGKGGVGLFNRPETEMKCAGAPLKFTFLTEDKLRLIGNRPKAELVYNTPFSNLFSVVPVHHKVEALFTRRNIGFNYKHTLRAIEPGRKIAIYDTPEGAGEMAYDMIHVVPPQRAPEPVRQSALRWQAGPLAADGWVEVDKATLRHPRFPNVFAVGDVAGVPRGKTAASVKWQVPVAADNITALIAGQEMEAVYNGYTSCPMVSGYGRAMLVEFDYAGNLTPSFPFIDPLRELWVSWAIEEKALKPTYFAMLRGFG